VTRLTEVSREDLQARRQAVLKRVGTSYEDLKARAEGRSLVGDEWSAWDELREIEFLLGDDEATG
jgi:hypothetical protein